MRCSNLLTRGETYLPKFENYQVKLLNWDSDYELGHIKQQKNLAIT